MTDNLNDDVIDYVVYLASRELGGGGFRRRRTNVQACISELRTQEANRVPQESLCGHL